MAKELQQQTDFSRATIYQIRLRGHLGSQWKEWLGGLDIRLEDNGDTLLTGPVSDQAALHSILRKIRDLSLPLVALQCLGPSDL